jgi:hypothetical protein
VDDTGGATVPIFGGRSEIGAGPGQNLTPGAVRLARRILR